MRHMLQGVRETRFAEQHMPTADLFVGDMQGDVRVRNAYLHTIKQQLLVRLSELDVQMKHVGFTASFQQICAYRILIVAVVHAPPAHLPTCPTAVLQHCYIHCCVMHV